MKWFFVLACLLPAFWVSFLATWGMRWLSPRLGLIDKPAARKVHRVPTPLGGGVGIIGGVLLPLAVVQFLLWLWSGSPPTWIPPELRQHLPGAISRTLDLWGVLGAAGILAAMGLWDDFRPLPWQPRIAIQFLMASLVVMSGVRATLFMTNPWIGGILSVLWLVVLVNSFNFLDNMDGLSSGIALIVSVMFAAMMLLKPGDPRWLVAGFFLVLAGALLGFLCHNWSPARIFMGDSGSYFLGFTIGSMTLQGTFYTPESSHDHVMLAPLCVLAVPLYDTLSVIWIRLREGRSPFQPDKKHFSHRLVALGLKPVQAVLTVHLTTLTTGIAGLLLYAVPDWTSGGLVLTSVVCILAIIAILESAPRPATAPPPAPTDPGAAA